MDFNKISEYTILHIVTALAILITASVVRYACVRSGSDTGTANLVFAIVLGIEIVVYLILMKAIIYQVEKFSIWRKDKKTESNENTKNITTQEGSVHDRIVRERFEESITLFQEYTQKTFGKYITADEIKKLNDYVELFAQEQSFENIVSVQVPPRQISNNDLYHFGWNLWNHFKNHLQDQRQECLVAWLKIVFSNLSDVELSIVKGKLTIYDTKGKISIQKSIPDYLRFLKE
ncbi:hypothetical protein [Viscerimonas tarda]